jgi:lipopolysaccharide/colanic/teichoic acid biosynthesis glycosyltransferase
MRQRTRFSLSTVLLDGAALVVAGWAASEYVFGTPLPWLAPVPNPRPMVGLLIAGVLLGGWASLRVIEPSVPRPSYPRAVATFFIALGTVTGGLTFLRTYYSRSYTVLTLGGWLILALVHRAARRRQPWVDELIVITDEKELVADLAESPHTRVLEVLDPRGHPPANNFSPASTTIVVDYRAVLSDVMASFVSSCSMAGYSVRPLTDVYEEHTGRVALVHLAEGWEISVPLERRALYAPLKRALESLLVLVAAPLWVLLGGLTWLLIRIDSPGPALFQQRRVGRHGRPFMMYKFRTMVAGADDDGPQFTAPQDPRVTRLGRALRTLRLDEIPQLVNVLKGDMALVGPRAEQLAFAEQFEILIPFYRHRHLIRPGITGWAQVNAGYAGDLDGTIEKLTYDLYYVRHMSPWLDLETLRKTVATVLGRRGAR